jgi:hypothetical protein
MEHVNALIGAVSALAGIILTLFASRFLRRYDLDLKIWERLLDQRIEAHQSVIGLAIKMRVMVSFEEFDPEGELARAPEVMLSRDAFEEYLTEFARASSHAGTWLSTAVKRELNFVQDYLWTLHTNTSGIPSDRLRVVGSFIRNDFINLSSNLEKVAFGYFEREVRKLKLGDLAEHHKYAPEETEHRLRETILIGQWKSFQSTVQRATQGGAIET